MKIPKSNNAILVIGSFMMDLVTRTPRVPKNGETVIGTSFLTFPGGKGANQAVAAARLGVPVIMAGKLGMDAFGDEMLATLQAEGVSVDFVLRHQGAATGVGSVTLDAKGNNRIVVIPGANLLYNLADLSTLESVMSSAGLIMLQLEMDLDLVKEAVMMGARHGVPVILNPAPAHELDDELLQQVTYLTPNETEAEILTGVSINDLSSAKMAAQALLARGPKNVIITLAEEGALVATAGSFLHIPGYSVQAVDTVAAGDAFNGALAAGIVQGYSLEKSVRYANVVGALTVTREGAIPSLPNRSEADEFSRKLHLA